MSHPNPINGIGMPIFITKIGVDWGLPWQAPTLCPSDPQNISHY